MNLSAQCFRIILYKPFWNSVFGGLFTFPMVIHVNAIKKFLVMLVALFLPLIFAYLYQLPNEGEEAPSIIDFMTPVLRAELFIYIVSLLMPYMYIVYEKIDFSKSKDRQYTILNLFVSQHGSYTVYSWVSFFVIVIAAFLYALYQHKHGNTHPVIAKTSIGALFFSFYVYYLSILEGLGQYFNYNDEMRQGERSFEAQLRSELGGER